MAMESIGNLNAIELGSIIGGVSFVGAVLGSRIGAYMSLRHIRITTRIVIDDQNKNKPTKKPEDLCDISEADTKIQIPAAAADADAKPSAESAKPVIHDNETGQSFTIEHSLPVDDFSDNYSKLYGSPRRGFNAQL